MTGIVKSSMVVAVLAVGLYFADVYFAGGVCKSKVRLDGKTVIITGANTGIGKETAIDLASRGARVIIGCRSKARGEQAVADIARESGNDNIYLKLIDLSSFKSVREFANDVLKTEERLDILINNAGMFMGPFQKTEDGFESHFQVNHLGHFLLTQMLIELLKKSAPSRIINVSSMAHSLAKQFDFEDIGKEEGYSPSFSYAISKLANIVHAQELSKRFSIENVTSYSLHPGCVLTEIDRHLKEMYPILVNLSKFIKPLMRIVLKNSKEGAQTTICCAVEQGLEELSGEYFTDCGVGRVSKHANDTDFGKKLWDFSMKATKLE